MTELAIQAAFQTTIQGMSEFENADVVINDYSVFDRSTLNAPYVIIGNSNAFEARQDVQSPNTRWDIIVTLVERFTDWEETLNNLRLRRQALIDRFDLIGDNRSAGGLEATTIDLIRSETPILPRFDPSVEDVTEAMPIFLFQDMAFVTEEF